MLRKRAERADISLNQAQQEDRLLLPLTQAWPTLVFHIQGAFLNLLLTADLQLRVWGLHRPLVSRQTPHLTQA